MDDLDPATREFVREKARLAREARFRWLVAERFPMPQIRFRLRLRALASVSDLALLAAGRV